MKKNLIAIIALTAALAASTSAFADTVQISEEELNKPVSTYAPDAMPIKKNFYVSNVFPESFSPSRKSLPC